MAHDLNSTAISKYVTLKMTDVPSKYVWKIKESCYVYAALCNSYSLIFSVMKRNYGYKIKAID